MGVVLSEGWGGRQVSEAVAATLAQAQALAARQRRAAVGPSHLLGALLRTAQDPATHAGAVLRAGGHDLAALSQGRPDDPPPSGSGDRPITCSYPGGRPSTPLRPEPAVAEVLRDLDAWISVTGDRRLTTLHLLAALSRSATPEGAFLRQTRLTPDAVLATGARCRSDVHADDAAFVRAGDRRGTGDASARDTVLSVPEAPRSDDLKTRTVSRRSSTMARLMSTQMPEGGRVNTRAGVTTIRGWTLTHTLHYLLTVGVVLLLLDQGIEKGAWQFLVCAALVPLEVSFVPWAVWLPAKSVALWLAPPPLCWFVIASVLLEMITLRYELWMKRVDLAEPKLPVSHFWRAYWREVYNTAWERVRTRYEN